MNKTSNKQSGTVKFSYGKYGLKCDPRGAQVTMEWQGRTLLGDVRDCYRDPVTGGVRLKITHFCGDAWPVDPMALAVDVLVRDYESAES